MALCIPRTVCSQYCSAAEELCLTLLAFIGLQICPIVIGTASSAVVIESIVDADVVGVVALDSARPSKQLKSNWKISFFCIHILHVHIHIIERSEVRSLAEALTLLLKPIDHPCNPCDHPMAMF